MAYNREARMKAPDGDTIYGWEECPDHVRRVVNGILDHYRKVLGYNLIGFYLHGSLAMGCFNPRTSDVDFLAIVRSKLSTDEKKSIISYLIEASATSSPVSPEMSIVTLNNVTDVVYPTPFELHYSSSWQERYLSGDVDWGADLRDEDLVLHFLAVRHRGICLHGQPIKTVFPKIPREMCVASLAQDLEWTIRKLASIPVTYAVLNPCRALGFLKTGAVMSKKEGGAWALRNLPSEFSPAVRSALAIYAGLDDAVPDEHRILDLIGYAKNEISKLKTA